jgi:hypothetical protein
LAKCSNIAHSSNHGLWYSELGIGILETAQIKGSPSNPCTRSIVFTFCPGLISPENRRGFYIPFY